MYYIALLLTVEKKRVCAPLAHETNCNTDTFLLYNNYIVIITLLPMYTKMSLTLATKPT